MTRETAAGLIFIAVLVIATVAFRAWRKHVIREEYERFAGTGQDAQEEGSAGSDSLETSS